MRRTRDLVRLSSERVDDRKLAFDAPWFRTNGADDASASDSESDEDEDEDALDSALDADADDAGPGPGPGVESDEFDGLDKSASEEDEDEDEVPQSSSARKRKRPQPPQPPSSLAPSLKSQSGLTRPRKKVAFATSVKATATNLSRPSSSPKDHTLSRSSTTRPSPYKKSNVKALAETKLPTSRTRKSAANAPPPTTQKRKPEAGEGKDDAYDFSKFF